METVNRPVARTGSPRGERARHPVVLQVLPALEAGGVERGTVEITAAIVEAGGTALVASAGGRMVREIERAGGTHLQLPLRGKSPWTIWRNAGRLARLIRAHGVDIVHARSRAPAWSAWLAAQRTGVRFVTTWHGVYGESLPGKHRYNAVMARGERVIAISDFVARRVAAEYGVGPDRLRTIPRGAELSAFDPGEVPADRRRALAADWNLPAGASVIMLPGRITGWKGHGLLIEALARLPREAGEWICLLVGPEQDGGGAAQRLLQQASKLGLGGKLRFTGLFDDMPTAYALADLVVVPSLKPEPFGRVVVEAQAMERPVVVAAHGGAMETVEHGVSGYLFDPGDPQALAETIAHVLRMSAEQRRHLGYWARQNVAGRFTTHAMQQATLDVYRELLPPARQFPAQAGAGRPSAAHHAGDGPGACFPTAA